MRDESDPATLLIDHARFAWLEGMCSRDGRRVVETGKGHDSIDLSDMPTAGALLGVIDGMGRLTDVVRQDGEWIVAIRCGDELQGYAADNLGEAAAWALLELWGAEDDAAV